MKRIARWWRKRQRAVDLDILWPNCKALCESVEQARRVFAFHVHTDRAWLTDFSASELDTFVENLI